MTPPHLCPVSEGMKPERLEEIREMFADESYVLDYPHGTRAKGLELLAEVDRLSTALVAANAELERNRTTNGLGDMGPILAHEIHPKLFEQLTRYIEEGRGIYANEGRCLLQHIAWLRDQEVSLHAELVTERAALAEAKERVVTLEQEKTERADIQIQLREKLDALEADRDQLRADLAGCKAALGERKSEVAQLLSATTACHVCRTVTASHKVEATPPKPQLVVGEMVELSDLPEGATFEMHDGPSTVATVVKQDEYTTIAHHDSPHTKRVVFDNRMMRKLVALPTPQPGPKLGEPTPCGLTEVDVERIVRREIGKLSLEVLGPDLALHAGDGEDEPRITDVKCSVVLRAAIGDLAPSLVKP